jgi:UDP-N-acetylglucosamine diphosphorylase/glucosamine-1-phosphate N-acetyltransferase
MKFILFDDSYTSDLYPIALTRAVADIRIGILTIKEKWEKHLDSAVFIQTKDYLKPKYQTIEITNETVVFINAAACPSSTLINDIQNLDLGEYIVYEGRVIAHHCGGNQNPEQLSNGKEKVSGTSDFTLLRYPWDIFTQNSAELNTDYQLLTKGRTSAPIDDTNTVLGNDVFLEPGAKVMCSILNSTSGPVYIGKDAEVMENSVIRGPFAMLEHSALKLSTKIYGATTVGPYCKVGGEVNNSVLIGYSNKGHDGFLGNSVIGEWCNLGADTNNSNLKNNYGTVKAYNFTSRDFISTGLQFCGLIMGDHSKSGINTMFNTGTVVGVSANIYGGGFPPKFIPSFSWGGADGFVPFDAEKAQEVAERMMERRGISFTEGDALIFNTLRNS